MNERNEQQSHGRRESDSKAWTLRIIIQTAVTILISLAAAFGGAVLGAQTKTAVLEAGFTDLRVQLTTQNAEMRTKLDSLGILVNQADVRNAGELARLRSDLDNLKREYDKRIESAESSVQVQNSALNGVRDKVNTMVGEMNARRLKERE